MTIEEVNTEISKRIADLRIEHSKLKYDENKWGIRLAIKELEAIQNLTKVIPSRSSQTVNVIEI